MKRTSKAFLAAFVCSFALAFTGCGRSTDSGASSAVNGSSAVSAAESSVSTKQPSESAPESTADTESTGASVTDSITSDQPGEPASSADSAPEVDALSPLWDNAQYKEDAEIGEGAHNVLIEVKIGGRSVTLTVRSDKDNLADILTESKLVEGDNGEYGLYIKKVNGVAADYETDNAYWGLSKDGTPTAVGASSVTIKDGEHYELIYTKADAEQPAA